MSSQPPQPDQKVAQAHLNLDELADDREEWDFFSEASESTRITEFVDIDLSVERESIASELEVLRSIYGDQAIRILRPSHDSDASPALQYEVDTSLPSYEDIQVTVLVSLPPSYPASSPPQLQLQSRYIGAFGVSIELFRDVFKTFFAPSGTVNFTPDTVVVFDGLQHVLETCSAWYADRLRAEKAGESVRERERTQKHSTTGNVKAANAELSRPRVRQPGETPLSVEIFEGESITDSNSIFIGRVCRLTDPSEVPYLVEYIKAQSHVGWKASTTIYTWVCEVEWVYRDGTDDRGEKGAGKRLVDLIEEFKVKDVLIVVTRYYGGVSLGSERFEHIVQATRSALEKSHKADDPRHRLQIQIPCACCCR